MAGLAFDWHAVDAGGILRARATDAAGNILSAVPAWHRLGHGNNAVDVIYVNSRVLHQPGEKSQVARSARYGIEASAPVVAAS